MTKMKTATGFLLFMMMILRPVCYGSVSFCQIRVRNYPHRSKSYLLFFWIWVRNFPHGSRCYLPPTYTHEVPPPPHTCKATLRGTIQLLYNYEVQLHIRIIAASSHSLQKFCHVFLLDYFQVKLSFSQTLSRTQI